MERHNELNIKYDQKREYEYIYVFVCLSRNRIILSLFIKKNFFKSLRNGNTFI